MKCPFCSEPNTKVVDSRLNQTADITRRRRECLRCEGRFTTYERVEELLPAVIKKDGRREPYQREKLLGGLQKACQKRPITTEQIESVVAGIEKRIASLGTKEIAAKTLGQMVMAELHQLDPVAYIRFASVYREFKDVHDFVADLQGLEPVEKESSNLSLPFDPSDD